MTVARQYVAERQQQREITASTAKAIVRDVKTLAETLPHGDYRSLSPRQVRRILARLERDFASTTVRRRLSSWRNLFAWLTENDITRSNPFESVQYGDDLLDTDVPFLEADVAAAVLEAAQHDPIAAFVVPLVFATGIKRAELLALTTADFHWHQDPPILHVAGDSNSRRAVPLPEDLRAAFDAFIDFLPAPPPPDQPLVAYTGRAIEYRLSALQPDPAPPHPLTLSTLRWTRAVLDLRAGVPEERVRAKLGLTSQYWRAVRVRLLPWIVAKGELSQD
jgi:site-specific recombinase XerC